MNKFKKFSNQITMVSGVAVAATAAFLVLAEARAVEKPKYSIEEIMKKGHKGDDALVKKVANGAASAAEIKQMLEYYKALAQNEPPKGDAAAWKSKTSALVQVTERLAKGDKSALADFKKASNCKACHSEFRPEKKK